MVNTQTWMMGLTMYFISLFIVITLFGVANATGNIVTNTDYYNALTDATNQSSSNAADNLNTDWKSALRFVFSFFLWDINVYNEGAIFMQYFWILRILIVYIPLSALIITMYYSLPWVSG